MARERLRISCKSAVRGEDRDVFEWIRRDLYSDEFVNVSPENPALGIRRAATGDAYMEFVTEHRQDVEALVNRWRTKKPSFFFNIEQVEGPLGEPCLSCGHAEPEGGVPAVFPVCDFRYTSPCPHCNADISRQAYEHVAGRIEKCPNCHQRVRLEFNEPLLKPNGDYNEPVVIVEAA